MVDFKTKNCLGSFCSFDRSQIAHTGERIDFSLNFNELYYIVVSC